MSQKTGQENQIEILQDVAETSRLIDLDNLDKYRKDVRETVLLYYGNNELKTQQDVADKLEVTRQTVDRRLNSDEARQFMKMFSHRDKDELDRWFEELAARHYNKALKGLKIAVKRAAEDKDVSPQVLQSCATALLNADQQFAKNLQEFGAIDKPENRVEEEEEEGDQNRGIKDVREELAEIYEKYHGGLPVMEAEGGGEG